MYVHAYDPQSGTYYKSMVYALVRIMDSTYVKALNLKWRKIG